tara:strand:- start:3581 stop:6010 length:2430 start_codon:yes stop_codon:yes gene_type:complete
MSNLTPEELSILRMFGNEITTAPSRLSLKQYLKSKNSAWRLENNVDKGKEEESKRREKTDDGYEKIGHGYKGFMMAHLLKPSHSGLTVDELEKAQLARASREFYEQGLGAAEQYLIQKNNPYKIDGELSNNEALVVINKEGKPEMAFRGTDKANLEDIKTDAAILFGREADTQQFKEADDLIQKVNEKYGMLPEHYTGFSLGGAKSLHFGQKYNTPTTNLNPFMGKNLTKNIHNTSQIQKVIRTVNDPVSIGLALTDEATHPSWRVKSILPLKKNTLNPIATHHLDNLTNDDNLERTEENMLNYQVKSIDSGMKLAEYQDLDRAVEAVNNGKSYAQWLYEDQTSRADSFIKPDGSYGLKGFRHIPEAKGMRAWVDAGGEFNAEEAVYINKLMSGQKPTQPTVQKLGGGAEGAEIQPVPVEIVGGPPAPQKTQKLESKFREEKVGGSPLTAETKFKMFSSRGGLPPIKEDGTITGLYGEQKFIEPEKRADYNRMREIFNEGLATVKTEQRMQNLQTRMAKLTDTYEPPTMSEDELSQRNDMITDATLKAHKENEYGLSEAERNTFVIEDKDDRQNILDSQKEEMDFHDEKAADLGRGMDAAGVTDDLIRSVHPTNLAVGMLAGSVVEKGAKLTGIDKMPTVPRDIIKGGLSGAISEKFASGLTGAALTPKGVGLNIGAGAAAYLVGDASSELIQYGLKKAGAGKDYQEAVSDIGSGFLSGGTYGAVVGGAEGAAIGSAVGAVGGLTKYGLEQAGATSKTAAEAEKAVDYGLTGGGIGATIGSVVPGVGTAVGGGIGFVAGEIGYGLSKLF